jgi:hypothetical protein
MVPSQSYSVGPAVGDPGTGLGIAVGIAVGAAVGVAVVREASKERAKSNTGVLGRKGISLPSCPEYFTTNLLFYYLKSLSSLCLLVVIVLQGESDFTGVAIVRNVVHFL